MYCFWLFRDPHSFRYFHNFTLIAIELAVLKHMGNGRMGLWRAGWALAGLFDQLVQATCVGAQCDGHMGRRYYIMYYFVLFVDPHSFRYFHIFTLIAIEVAVLKHIGNGRMGLWRAGWALAGLFDQLVQATRVGAQCDGHLAHLHLLHGPSA